MDQSLEPLLEFLRNDLNDTEKKICRLVPGVMRSQPSHEEREETLHKFRSKDIKHQIE